LRCLILKKKTNANFKAPNKSTNTFVFNAGFNYVLDTNPPAYVLKEKRLVKDRQGIGYGFIFRGGINESDVVGSGQYPFYTIAVFADKRLNKKSAFQLGTEVFFSKALERFIDFRGTGDFRDGATGDEDAKRVGVFLGHELRINKISILTQLGYYVYYPYDFEGQVYNRMGARYYFNRVAILFITCDTENAADCFQRTGDIVREEVDVPNFTRILALPNVELIVKEGPITAVVIETGDNLLAEVSAIVEGDRLVLSNTNDCNFVRDFNQTKIFVTAANITEIRSETQYDISSDGILNYPLLRLVSEDFIEDNGGTTTGTYHLNVNNDKTTIVGNNIASFFISGSTNDLSITFASGTGRFEGANLRAQNVRIRHRGTNKIIVNPIQTITGEILSTGDVIAVNRPNVVSVEELFTGKLIFQ